MATWNYVELNAGVLYGHPMLVCFLLVTCILLHSCTILLLVTCIIHVQYILHVFSRIHAMCLIYIDMAYAWDMYTDVLAEGWHVLTYAHWVCIGITNLWCMAWLNTDMYTHLCIQRAQTFQICWRDFCLCWWIYVHVHRGNEHKACR